MPSIRFNHIHKDIVGPLPLSQGNKHCLIVIDRFSIWPEAFPIADISAEIAAKALYNGLTSRFGKPAIIATDQGRQCESSLLKELLNLVGIKCCRTGRIQTLNQQHVTTKILGTVLRNWYAELH